MLVIFVGPPGTGKGTQSKRLIRYLNAVHLSTGDLLRTAIETESELGREAKEFIHHGQFVPCETMIGLIADQLEQTPRDQNLLLDGFPRTIHQAKELDLLLAKLGHTIGHVLALDTNRDELRRRLLERSLIEGRLDDDPATIRKRLEIYDARTAPLIDYYRQKSLLRAVDGMGSADEVFRRIQNALKEG
ncbi:MAG: adenylate kinase [Planctomycetaceae bacterium]|nr:adenylate kinase [Planctomycetaceae bacterium]